MSGPNLRSLLLRQAGLLDLCSVASPSSSVAIALIDGSADTRHPALSDSGITKVGDSRSVPAADHATFLASILVASEPTRQSGVALGISSKCILYNFSVVTDAMLSGRASTFQTASVLGAAVNEAVQAGGRVIVFGIEIRHSQSADWHPLSSAVRAASERGVMVIAPLGNSQQSQPTNWPGFWTVVSCDWRGRVSAFCSQPLRSNTTIVAPGERVPGAGPEGKYAVRSGTSFAAAVAAGAFAHAASFSPRRPVFDIAAELCPPTHRLLDGTRYQSRTGDLSWSQNLPIHRTLNTSVQMHP